MSLSTTSVAVVSTQGDPAPTAQFTISVAAPAGTAIYLFDNVTKKGISSVAGTAGTNSESVTIQYDAAASLSPGTYDDTITIQGCYENPCVHQVSGSPATVTSTYTVQATPPTLSSINPSATTAGVPGFTLTATGTSFTAQSTIEWNGSPRTTTYVSATELTAQISAADVASVGSFPVTVIAAPGGTPTPPISFTVNPPAALTLSSVMPSTLEAGSPGATVQLTGTGFNSTSVVQWNGASLATTVVSTTELTAQVPAADLAAVGTASVTVTNAAAPPGTSGPATVSIVDQSLFAVAFQITPTHSGAMQFNNAALPSASKWQVDLGGTPSYPLIADGKLFFTVHLGSTTELVALDQATGATVWGPILIGAPANAAYDSGRVFVLSDNIGSAAILQAFDAATGTQIWSATLGGQYWFTGAPTAVNGLVYAGGAGSGGTLYAVDESNGAIAWTASVMNGDNSSPAVTSSGVYVTYPCQTYDFDPVTGVLNWNNNGGCEGGGGATPVVANGVVYSPNATSGYSGITLDATSGAVLGSYQADTTPAVSTSAAYYLQSGTLRAVALGSNTVLWSFAGDGSLSGAPIVVDGWVFISSSTGNLYALDATSGAQLWTVNLGAAIDSGSGFDAGIPFSGLAAGQGLLVVPSGTKVTAYTLSTNP